jgi:hypothetical protein
MKVIGAGLPRTGTLSQKVALEMLGLGPCYHMVNVLGDLDQAAPWRRALEGDMPPADIFEGFQSTVDWPGAFFYRELTDAFPQAKVVLGVRDGDAWARSMRDTIWDVLYGDGLMGHLSAARGLVDPQWQNYTDLMREMWQRSGLMGDGEVTALESMSSAMRRYNEQVQQNVAPERLLVWSVTDGWGPLCEFLGAPVPDAPFPRLNDRDEFAGRIIDGSLRALREWRAAEQQETAGVAT